MKQSLYPFLLEVWACLRPACDLLKPVVHVRKVDGEEDVFVSCSIPGQDVTFRPMPPLEFILLPDSVQGLSPDEVISIPEKLTETRMTITSPPSAAKSIGPEELRERTVNLAEILRVRLSAKASSKGYKEIRRQLQEEANLRNRLLYASSEGWPGPVKDIESVLRARKRRAFILLTVYCLIFPYKEGSTLVGQVLIAFIALLDSLKPGGYSREVETESG